MELRRYSLILRRWLWLILLTTALAVLIAYVISDRQTRHYRATATLIIDQGQTVTSGLSYSDVLASQQLAKSYAAVAASRPVLATAAASLGLDSNAATACACLPFPDGGKLQISAAVPQDTQLVTVSGESSSQRFTADGVNAVAGAFSAAVGRAQVGNADSAVQDLDQQIQVVKGNIQRTSDDIQSVVRSSPASNVATQNGVSALQSQLTQEQATYGTLIGQLEQIRLNQAKATNAVKLVEPAVSPRQPYSPRVSLNVGLAALVALLGSVGLTLLLEYLDDRIRSPGDVEHASRGAATLGVIRRLAGEHEDELGPGRAWLRNGPNGGSRALEEYRLLRTNLEFACAGHGVKSLAITSAGAGEGKSTTAANLSIVLGQAGKRTLLVDADLRRPSLHRIFRLPNAAGFSTLFLMDHPEVETLCSESEFQNLMVLTSGPLPPNATELLGSARMHLLMAQFREHFDLVVFDSPPLLAVADASQLAAQVDGVVLVADSGRTRSVELSRARAVIDRASAVLLGVVLNNLDEKNLRRDYYDDSYGYDSATRSSTVNGDQGDRSIRISGFGESLLGPDGGQDSRRRGKRQA
ncbi:MAG: polysaccharide biosynthesis tyrosine autokinase [Dehalococcoidia bacterium]